MHAHQLIHPWQLATTWSGAHRRPAVVVSTAAVTQPPQARHWWTGHHVFTIPAPHTLPDNRSHYYPPRCVYLEGSTLSRMMDHL
jgi:hypothetical protein